DVLVRRSELGGEIVGHHRATGELFVDRKHHASHLSGSVVVGEEVPVAGRARAEVLRRVLVGGGPLAGMFQMDVHVDRHETGDVHKSQVPCGLATTGDTEVTEV